MNRAIVTIITITYDCRDSVKKTINSILTQTYPYIEYIIIDGDSKDGTKAIIEDNKKHIIDSVWKFYYKSEKDNGISDAFNKGINIATGDLILLLNAGDVLINSNVIADVVDDWIKSNKPDFLYYRVKVGKHTYIPSEKNEDSVWDLCLPPHQGSFISRALYRRVGVYNTDFKLRMDYDFFARCKIEGVLHKFIPRVIVDYEEGGASMQTRNAKTFYIEGLKIKKKYKLKICVMDYVYIYTPQWVRSLAKSFIRR